ncbi:DUF1150 family protein [Insolitispirillum peregrinum]|uniref:Uncharacterized protein n=1 Tax=Insolitispirillum peregrinum TaxID=80876 RepID=A0A1N7JTK4_9PROT|nr:DUF1150 family protein [Insolitispirillum peregrinum]SIS52692.1 hypothetical protein SAMN05421779_102463 [Insolitispirillum peregrinum]
MTSSEAIPFILGDTDSFIGLGLGHTAYVRQSVNPEGQSVWGIFGADGQPLGAAPSRDVAFAAIRQYELEPVSAH